MSSRRGTIQVGRLRGQQRPALDIVNDHLKLGKVLSERSFQSGNFRFNSLPSQVGNNIAGRQQRSVVKASFSPNIGGKSWARHGSYLERESAQPTGEKGRGFNEDSDDILIRQTLRNWQKGVSDDKLYKIILSPEHSERIDLKRHARQLMAIMSAEHGIDFEWVGIIHTNTDEPHVHLCLRSVDKDGERVGDMHEYLGTHLRENSRELLTKSIGVKMFMEVFRERENQLRERRFTELDFLILQNQGSDGIANITVAQNASWRMRETINQKRRRLEFLDSIGVVENINAISWQLPADFQKKLRRLGLLEQLTKQRIPSWNRVQQVAKDGVERKVMVLGEELTGRVLSLNIPDSFSARTFLVLEANDGVVYHINQPAKVQRNGIEIGDVISIRRIRTDFSDSERQGKAYEFNYVEPLKNWRDSWILDQAALHVIRGDSKVPTGGIGFFHEWQQALKEKIRELRSFTKDDVEIREATVEKRKFENLLDSNLELKYWSPEALKTPVEWCKVERDNEKKIIGIVIGAGFKHVLIHDVRGYKVVVPLQDIKKDHAPDLGTYVSVQTNPMPKLEFTSPDDLIINRLNKDGFLDLDKVSDEELPYVRGRAATWKRWKVLERITEEIYRISPSVFESPIKQVFSKTLERLKKETSQSARHQQAWLKPFTFDEVLLEKEALVNIDFQISYLHKELNALPPSELSDAMRARRAFWRERGLETGPHLVRNIRAYLQARELRTEIIRTMSAGWMELIVHPTQAVFRKSLEKNEMLIGRVMKESVKEPESGKSFLLVDSIYSGPVMIQSLDRSHSNVKEGDVVVCRGEGVRGQAITTTLVDWRHSVHLKKELGAERGQRVKANKKLRAKSGSFGHLCFSTFERRQKEILFDRSK